MQARQKSDKFGKGSVQGQKMKKKYGIFPNLGVGGQRCATAFLEKYFFREHIDLF